MESLVVDREVFEDLIRGQRQDIKKKRCGLKDALYILDITEDTFYKLAKDPASKIRKSGHGKYSLESIYKEAERLTEK